MYFVYLQIIRLLLLCFLFGFVIVDEEDEGVGEIFGWL